MIFGATGGTGRHLVTKALADGHDVTAFVRRPGALPAQPRLTVEEGDVTAQPDAIARALDRQDVVISALGVGKSFKSHSLMQRALGAIVPAMQRHGPRRLILTSAVGVGETYGDAPLLMRLFFSTLLRDIYADKAKAEEIVRRSALDWTIVCPVALTDGPATNRYEVAPPKLRGFPRISRADVATCLLHCAQTPSSNHMTLIVSS